MNILYGLNGKGVATVEGATQVPREGDLLFLNLTGNEELFRVRRVVWEAKIAQGSEGKEGLARVHNESGAVYILIESMEEVKGSSATSS